MDLNPTISVATNRITSLASETICLIAEHLDAWDVGHLFCCGNLFFNKLLFSASHIRHVVCNSNNRPYFAIPNVIMELKSLKSLVLRRKDHILVLQPSTWDFLKTLAVSLEELKLSGIYSLSECANIFRNSAMTETSDSSLTWPNLTSLEVKRSTIACLPDPFDLSLLPHNLTRLRLKGPLEPLENDILSQLPPMLVDLHLEAEGISLRGCWVRKYPSLTSLHLDSFKELCFDCDGLSSLPHGLLRLSFGNSTALVGLDLPRLGPDGPITYDALQTELFFFRNLPPTLTYLSYRGEGSGFQFCEFSFWSSLRHLSMSSFHAMHKLPNLVSLRLFGNSMSWQCERSLEACPPTLHTLKCKGLALSVAQLTSIPTLKRLICGAVLEQYLPHLPPSLTYLKVQSIHKGNTDASWKAGKDSKTADAVFSVASWMQELPSGNLTEVSHKGWWTWLRVDMLAQSTFEDARRVVKKNSKKIVMIEPLDDETTEPEQFMGVDGSLWTSVGHAIALDSVALILELLHHAPSLWHEVRSYRALRVAVLHTSWRILEWLDSQHLVAPWANFQDSSVLLVDLPCDEDVADFLYDRGFNV